MHSKKISILGILFLSLTRILSAQDVDLERIVVTPSRIEQSYSESSRRVDVVTSKDIDQAQATDISGVIDDLSSVDISDYGGIGASKTIKMRGSTAAQVLIMIDGRPINSPRDGQVDLNNIPLDNIDKVEVMYGPASNLYGAAAMGGAINIITKQPPEEGMKTTFNSSFGTFRTYVERLTNGARISNFGYLISGGYESSEGFRTNSEFNSRDFNTKFNYKLNDNNDLNLATMFYKSNAGAPGPITAPDIDNQQKNIKNSLDLGWAFRPDNASNISAKIYNNYDRLEFNENSMDSIYDTGIGKSIHATQVRGYDLQLDRKFSEFYQAICGFSYISNFNDSTTSAKHKYNVRAVFLENTFNLFKKLNLGLGARVDDYSNFGAQASPSLTLKYKINDNNSIHGLVSRSFRAPTFNDLYWPNDGYSKGNSNLRPEKGTTAEIGLETRIIRNNLFNITYYHSIYDELINWMPDDTNFWTPINIGSAVINGVELNDTIYLIKNIECNLGYTFLYAKDDKSGKFLIYQPKNKVNLSLKYNGPQGLVIEAKSKFTGTRFHNAVNSIKVKQYFVFGLDVSKKFKNITYYATINNLLARRYQDVKDYPMPGFSINGGFKLNF